MGELEFRAVIGKNATIHFTLNELVEPIQRSSIRELVIPWILKGNDPDRYTGIKDRKGVGIYEGDIVNIECACGYKANMPVEWGYNGYRLKQSWQHNFPSGELELERPERTEVIGNIHE